MQLLHRAKWWKHTYSGEHVHAQVWVERKSVYDLHLEPRNSHQTSRAQKHPTTICHILHTVHFLLKKTICPNAGASASYKTWRKYSIITARGRFFSCQGTEIMSTFYLANECIFFQPKSVPKLTAAGALPKTRSKEHTALARHPSQI